LLKQHLQLFFFQDRPIGRGYGVSSLTFIKSSPHPERYSMACVLKIHSVLERSHSSFLRYWRGQGSKSAPSVRVPGGQKLQMTA